jgi:hypothetical protein
MIPDNPGPKSLIWLHPSGKSADALPEGQIEWFVKRGFTVMVPDLIGTGETGPGYYKGDAYIGNVSYNVWFATVLTGRSITAIRAADVVRLNRLLKEYHGTEDVYALAKAEMSPVLLHAAVFEPSIARVALLEPLISYNSLVVNRYYNPAFVHGAVPGMLKEYDLPDLAAVLAPRRLMLADAVDGTGTSNNRQEIDREMEVIRSAYRQKKATDSLLIESGQHYHRLFEKWTGLL